MPYRSRADEEVPSLRTGAVDYYPAAEREHLRDGHAPNHSTSNTRFLSHLCDIERDQLPFPTHSLDGVLC